MESNKRMRKPNWTEEQCLLLAQLGEEHKGILKGKFGPGVTARGKKQTWELIAQNINASFPLVVRTSEDCEKRWYVLQSKARGEIAAHKRESSRTGECYTTFFFLTAGSYLKQLYVNMWSTALFSRGWTTC